MNVSLTFDNGPDYRSTPRVLDALLNRGISATFFVVGEQLADARNAELVDRVADTWHIGSFHFGKAFAVVFALTIDEFAR